MNWLDFHKVLPTLILPFGASLFILAASLRFRRRALVAIPLATLWILGTPAISDTLMRSLEDRYPPYAVEQCPQADAVFAFGGILKPREQLTGEIDGADRFNRALALYAAGRAHTLVLSSGQAHHPGGSSEGDRLSEIARLRGVPDQAIIVIHQTTNTKLRSNE